jgi:hypothetical protein
MDDPYLAAVIGSVESGGEPVAVSLELSSGSVVTGFVCPADVFARVTVGQARDVRLARTPVQKRKPANYEDADAHAARIEGLLDDVDAASNKMVTISNAKVEWSAGGSLSMPTLRVNLDAVTAWWLEITATPFSRSVGGLG